ISGEDFVQFRVVGNVFEIDLNVDDMVYRQPRRLDDRPHPVEGLANLLGKFFGHRTVRSAGTLPGDINVTVGLKAGCAESTGRSGTGRSNGPRLRVYDVHTSCRQEQRAQNARTRHAAWPRRAALRMDRSRWPTINSSPGWMVMDTSSRRFSSFTSLGLGLGLSPPSCTAETMLGLSMLSASITGSPSWSFFTQSLTVSPNAAWSHVTRSVG